MPAKPPAPGAVECRFVHTQEGRTWSFHLFYSDGLALEYTTTDLEDLNTALDTVWAQTSTGMGRLSNEVNYTTLITTDLFSETAPRIETTESTTGQQTGAALPMNNSMVIQRIQDRRYRGGKSHVYLCGLIDSFLDTDQNFWKAVDVNGFISDFGAMDAAAHAVTTSHSAHWNPVCVSYRNANAERLTPVLFGVTSTSGQLRVCSRRRRLPKL